ncbi:unnamed protein product [Kluyveromyces dobzhanskii CBS 2104]|uniref:WGS project CCBQ000000000 data, contig 00098 n=1 Tax=Kluyveromyces dobzhanskii CBS 2104 TaxID=1427455 RepID=A0A0A8L3L7_9SACH|nr:unnamed protein product [Kluyveromyces dobzhanskii CBS 2104]
MSESVADVAEEYSQVVVDTPPSSVDGSSKSAGQEIESTEAKSGEAAADEDAAPAPAPVKVSFPKLGGGAGSSSAGGAVSWGSVLKSAVSSVKNVGRASSPGSAKPLRSRNIQEVFSLDLQAQYQITKSEFSSIVQYVKQKYDVSVESTLSKTSRTFLISGATDKIGYARRELVKKLTKPVSLTFEVPSKTRSAIIGSGGKTIRAISDATGVKIVVPKEVEEGSYDEDLEDFSVTISLHGDAESVTVAKNKVLDIVKEETKNARIVVNVEDSKLVPFIDLESVEIPADVKAQLFANNEPAEIALNGPRDNVKLAKVKVINYLNELGLQIVVKREKVPFKFHSLINPAELKEKFHVEVQFPKGSNDDQFVFIGPTDNVNEAIVYAKNSSKFHVVESLEISKAHGKNVQHAKNLVLYFQKYDALKEITEAYPQVQVVLPKSETISDLDAVIVTLITKNDAADDIKTVRKQIVSLVNELAPEQTLVVSDLDYHLFHKDIKQCLIATEDEVPFVQLGDLFPGSDDILLITKVNEDDFKPSDDELKAKLESVNQQLEPIRKKQGLLASKVITLESKSQEELFGESKVALSLINEAVSHTGAHALIKLNTPSAGQITIRGDDQGCKIASAAVESIVANPSTDSKTTFQVPTSVVSRLIGPKGAHLQQIRSKFDVQTSIPQDSSDEQTEVTLTGLEYNLGQAKAYILAEAKKWSDIITKELIVPIKYHRTLSGSQGTYRIRLESKYSVFIRFPKDSEIVTIRGPSRGVKSAYEELKALLDFEIENGHKELIKVPIEYVTRVIGKSGETINDIKAEFGVELNFLDKTDSEKAKEAGEVELEIIGSRSNIKEAASKVKSIIEKASSVQTVTIEDIDSKFFSDIIGRSGSQLKEIISKAGGDDIRTKRVKIPDASSDDKVITIFGPVEFVNKVSTQIREVVSNIENSITEELNIPQEKYGGLIGPAGSVRRDLETEFKVRINVPNKNSSEEKVTISGSAAGIEACKKKIEKEIIRDNFDLEIEVPAKYHSYVSNSGLIFQTLRNEFSIDVSHGNLTRTAQGLSRTNYKVPENVAGGENDKVNIVTQPTAELETKVETIPWRLTYSPIDLSDVLGEDYKKDEESREEVLEKASKLIEERISEAKAVNTEGFIWVKDPKKFNSIVGPNGRNIKEIRTATKTVIHVPRKNDKVNNVIYVKGSEEGVKKAAALISKKLE